MDIKEQIKTINPSVPPALFRLLMREESLSYLRDDKVQGIIGFEIIASSKGIAGFALIGMRKRTIYAYRSDSNDPTLIIFPPIDKLFNADYGLLDLSARKVFISSDEFKPKVLSEGFVGELVKDLTPPEKSVDLPDSVTEQMVRIMLSDYSDQDENEEAPAHTTVERFIPVNRPGYEATPVEVAEQDTEPLVSTTHTKRTPADKVDAEVFESEQAIMDYVILNFGVNPQIMTTLLNALLAKTQGFSKEDRLYEYKKLVIRLLNENPQVVMKDD